MIEGRIKLEHKNLWEVYDEKQLKELENSLRNTESSWITAKQRGNASIPSSISVKKKAMWNWKKPLPKVRS